METTALGTLKRGYATCAQATGRLLERVGILDDEPPRATTGCGIGRTA